MLSGVNAFADVLHGQGGNDTINGSASGDTLDGGAGNDVLTADPYGNATTLIGGTGNDTLTGSYYSDTYLFNIGDGQDTLSDYTPGYAQTDRIVFGPGIKALDVTALRSGVDMVFKVGEGADQVTVKNWFAGPAEQNQIERVEFADGSMWLYGALAARVIATTGTGHDSLDWIDTWSSNPSQQMEQFKTSNGRMSLQAQVNSLIEAMATFAVPAMGESSGSATFQDSFPPLAVSSWG